MLQRQLVLPRGLTNGSIHAVRRVAGRATGNGFKTLHRPNAIAHGRNVAGAQLTANKSQNPLDFRIRQPRPLSTQTDAHDEDTGTYSEADHEHAVISAFDLFSIGIGPSSSHTVGPMRAGNIFVSDLIEAGILPKVRKIRISIYGSLALTGEGHMTPSALLLGLEGANVETVDTAYVPARFSEIKEKKKLFLGSGLAQGGGREVDFEYERDFVWEWGRKLPLHSNGMRFSVFDEEGMILATNDMFSVGGGFVVNGALSIVTTSPPSDPLVGDASEDAATHLQMETNVSGKHPADLAENLFYKEIRRSDAAGDRRTGSEVKPHDAESTTLPSIISGATSTAAVGNAPDEAQDSSDSSHLPRYAFRDTASLLKICHQHNLTIAQVVYENEKSHGYTDDEIFAKLFSIWGVMDNSILEGVQAPLDSILPGSLKLHRRAPALYQRLTRGLYPSHSSSRSTPGSSGPTQPQLAEGKGEESDAANPPISSKQVSTWQSTAKSAAMMQRSRQPPRVHGSLVHPIPPSPTRRTTLPAMDYLTVYAIAVNETNAAGGRIVTAPTNGAAGIVPAVLKYLVEFISDDPERDVATFLLTAAALGMLFKRGATISAAEGGCMAEVGVACAMSAGAFAACMGASPETVEQATEIAIEHNLGLTCDPIGGLVQAPCIERNALGAIKAVSSANLALSSAPGKQKVRLDDAIRAMRLTAKGMRNEFKETSLSGLATSVPLNIPVSVPDC